MNAIERRVLESELEEAESALETENRRIAASLYGVPKKLVILVIILSLATSLVTEWLLAAGLFFSIPLLFLFIRARKERISELELFIAETSSALDKCAPTGQRSQRL